MIAEWEEGAESIRYTERDREVARDSEEACRERRGSESIRGGSPAPHFCRFLIQSFLHGYILLDF